MVTMLKPPILSLVIKMPPNAPKVDHWQLAATDVSGTDAVAQSLICADSSLLSRGRDSH